MTFVTLNQFCPNFFQFLIFCLNKAREVQDYIDEIFRSIIMLIMEPSCSGYGRDNCIDLCLKFVDRANGCGWTSRFVVFGVPKLLRVAATIPELNLPNSLPLTEHTKMHVACCLCTVYDDIYSDLERETFQDTVNAFIKYFHQLIFFWPCFF